MVLGLSALTALGLALGLGSGLPLRHGSASAQAPPPGFFPDAPASAPIQGGVQQSRAGMASAGGPNNIMILLDDSDSMADPIDQGGESKMVAAKRTVLEVLRNISPATRIGLRVYGDSANLLHACQATSVLVPLGQNNRNLIASKMIGLRPTGMTPISYTIQRSLAEDFNVVDGNRTIILISDGMETCSEDPCRVAVRLQQMGVNIKINVIGLGLQDYEATRQLRCVALGTKGKFYSANTAAELSNSLNKAMAVETRVQGTILTPARPPALPPGQAPTGPVAAPPGASVAPPKTYQETVLPAAVPIRGKKR